MSLDLPALPDFRPAGDEDEDGAFLSTGRNFVLFLLNDVSDEAMDQIVVNVLFPSLHQLHGFLRNGPEGGREEKLDFCAGLSPTI